MMLIKRYVFTVIPMFSEATALYCLFILFGGISTGEKVGFSFPVYITCLLLCALINTLLFRRERSLLTVGIFNALAASLTTAFVLLSPNNILGVFMYIYVCFMCLYPAPRIVFYMCYPVTHDRMMTHCDMAVLGTAIILISQTAGLEFEYISLCFTAIALNLIALSSLRIMRSQQSANPLPGMQRGFILVGAGAGLFIAAVFFASMLLPAIKETIVSILQAVLNFVSAIIISGYRIITYLMKKLPFGSIEPPSSMEEPMAAPPEYELEDIVEFPIMFYALLVLFMFGLIVSLSRWLYKNRKLRLQMIDLTSGLKKEKSRTPSLFSIIFAFFRRLYENAAFSLRLLMNFNTVAGAFLRIERCGKRYGQPRHRSEPPREFLMRVCTAEARPAFLQLADEIDRMCFAPGRIPNKHMGRLEIRALLSGLKPHIE